MSNKGDCRTALATPGMLFKQTVCNTNLVRKEKKRKLRILKYDKNYVQITAI